MKLLVESVEVAPLMENAYLVGDSETKKALFLDPGGEVDKLCSLVDRLNLTPIAVLCTHGHIDHVAGVAPLLKKYQINLWMHRGDQFMVEQLRSQAIILGFALCEVPVVGRWLEDGETIALGARTGRWLHTPGHSPGSSALVFEEDKAVFTGDTLFAGSIGRCDLPGGSTKAISCSISEKLFTLDPSMTIYPGHGAISTIGKEKIMSRL